MNQHYKQALESARVEFHALLDQRAEIEQRITRLRNTIQGLEALVGEKDSSEEDAAVTEKMGLSDAIRKIVDVAKRPIKPTEIRDVLVTSGFDPGAYANLLTVVHNTLARLERQHQVQEIRIDGDVLGWVPWPERQKWQETRNTPPHST